MTDQPHTQQLAELCAPRLASLQHPGDATTKPFTLALPIFQTATLPEGMNEEQAEEMGLPTPDLALHFCEAFLHLMSTLGVETIDAQELANLRKAAEANEPNRVQRVNVLTDCGAEAFRCVIRDWDTKHPRVACSVMAGLGRGDCNNGHKAVA